MVIRNNKETQVLREVSQLIDAGRIEDAKTTIECFFNPRFKVAFWHSEFDLPSEYYKCDIQTLENLTEIAYSLLKYGVCNCMIIGDAAGAILYLSKSKFDQR